MPTSIYIGESAIRTSIAVAIVMTLLTGCGNTISAPQKSPGETVRAFLQSANEAKYSEAETFLSKECTQGKIAGFVKLVCDQITRDGSVAEIDVVSEDIRGEGATVLINILYKDHDVKKDDKYELILRDGKWQLSKIRSY